MNLSDMYAQFTDKTTKVWCTFARQVAGTNELQDIYFCQYCGSTTHAAAFDYTGLTFEQTVLQSKTAHPEWGADRHVEYLQSETVWGDTHSFMALRTSVVRILSASAAQS